MNEELVKRFFKDFVIPFNEAGFRTNKKAMKFIDNHFQLYSDFSEANFKDHNPKYWFFQKKIKGKWYFFIFPAIEECEYLESVIGKL